MFVKRGDGKILSVIEEEELDEKSKKAVDDKLASKEQNKTTKKLEK